MVKSVFSTGSSCPAQLPWDSHPHPAYLSSCLGIPLLVVYVDLCPALSLAVWICWLPFWQALELHYRQPSIQPCFLTGPWTHVIVSLGPGALLQEHLAAPPGWTMDRVQYLCHICWWTVTLQGQGERLPWCWGCWWSLPACLGVPISF